jgi:hypothetical protein
MSLFPVSVYPFDLLLPVLFRAVTVLENSVSTGGMVWLSMSSVTSCVRVIALLVYKMRLLTY